MSFSMEPGAKPALPLDWTRVKRKRPEAATGDDCCDDPATCRRRRNRLPLGRTISTEDSGIASSSSSLVEGVAFLCLHEMDPSWFQGYFFPRSSLGRKTKPWGLLAVQEDVEDCLACQDGGYRRLSITVYQPGSKPFQIKNIDWTGGDMVILGHERLSMDTESFFDGTASLSFVHQYFGGLLKRLREEYQIAEGTSLLEWLPEIAIAKGDMKIALPNKNAQK